MYRVASIPLIRKLTWMRIIVPPTPIGDGPPGCCMALADGRRRHHWRRVAGRVAEDG